VFARALCIFIALVPVGQCQSLGFFDQFWPDIKVYVKTSQNTRLYFVYSGTRTQEAGYTDGQLGAHIDLYRGAIFKGRGEGRPDATRSRLLMIRAGYLFSKTPNPNPTFEHTPTLEVIPRFYLPKGILFSARNRYDFRFVNGVYTPRYRLRLRVERTFEFGKRAITPYGEAEAFYDRRYGINRFRFSAGSEFEINKRIVLEGYCLRQQDSQTEPHGINVAGVVLQIYLR
jgi:hypothetical protein